jgi:hypothetical protein
MSLPSHLTRRHRGQTAMFGRYEWIYNPDGLTHATLVQIQQLQRAKQGPVSIYQWPKGALISLESLLR